ncbi:hypothetical protein ACFQY7_27985 [Actinomadura luteofluorescens]|uniref:hypothetical protein n=1 Tax=Actinomadura luteofluorescens TaxID=46163 RepID=UPI00363CFDF6
MTMLQDVLNVPNAMNVLWTLSYEMAFYLLVVALFVVGGHRRSALPPPSSRSSRWWRSR